MIAGGSSIISISSRVQLSSLLVSIEDDKAEGYYELSLASASRLPERTRSASTSYSYVAYLQLSQDFSENFEILLAARTIEGDITRWWSSNVEYVAAGTGDLQVSLSFNNEKDLDLYLVEPNGYVINYYNRRSYLYEVRCMNRSAFDMSSDNVMAGLDLDSNPGCSIDSVDNENISIPKEYLLKGKYEVWVNLYSNCDPSIETLWSVTALIEGKAVEATSGSNPASGKFEIGARNNFIGPELNDRAVKVMEFTIDDGISPGDNAGIAPRRVTPHRITQSARYKLQEVEEFNK